MLFDKRGFLVYSSIILAVLIIIFAGIAFFGVEADEGVPLVSSVYCDDHNDCDDSWCSEFDEDSTGRWAYNWYCEENVCVREDTDCIFDDYCADENCTLVVPDCELQFVLSENRTKAVCTSLEVDCCGLLGTSCEDTGPNPNSNWPWRSHSCELIDP